MWTDAAASFSHDLLDVYKRMRSANGLPHGYRTVSAPSVLFSLDELADRITPVVVALRQIVQTGRSA